MNLQSLSLLQHEYFGAALDGPHEYGGGDLARVHAGRGIGTYVGLRGGNEYPTLLRKTEPKPIRVFLQGGEKDLNIYGGDWWMANQELERSLTLIRI